MVVGYLTPGVLVAELLGWEYSSSQSNLTVLNSAKEYLENKVKDKLVTDDKKFYQGAPWGDVAAGAYGIMKLINGVMTLASSVTIGAGAAGLEIGSGGTLSLAVGTVATVDVAVAVTGVAEVAVGAGVAYAAGSGMGDHREKLSEAELQKSGSNTIITPEMEDFKNITIMQY